MRASRPSSRESVPFFRPISHSRNRKGPCLNSPHAINQFTDVDKREVEYRIRMLNKGVHVIHGGGALIHLTHSDEDIEQRSSSSRGRGGQRNGKDLMLSAFPNDRKHENQERLYMG